MHSAIFHDGAAGTVSTTATRPPLAVSRQLVWAVAATIVVAYFVLLPWFPLAEPDEARYAEIPREMLELGDWITPHLNYVVYAEKPPLVYWLTATAMRLLGTSNGVARLWPAFFGVLGIIVAYRLGRSMYGPWTGYASAAILATCPLYFAMSQVLTLDIPLAVLMSIGLSAFWFAYIAPARRRQLILLVYVATALATLTKGLVAILLTGGIVGAFLVLRRDLKALRWVVSPLGIVCFMAIVLPWLILVCQRNPGFFDFFIVDQHFRRYATTTEHVEAVYFFVPILIGGMIPWSILPLLVPRLAAHMVSRLARLRVGPGTLYCVLWGGLVFAFFSISRCKLATYILPAFCPFAVLAARFVERTIHRGRREVYQRGSVLFLVLGVACVGGGFVAPLVSNHWRVPIIVPRLYVAGVGLIAAGMVARRLLQPPSAGSVALQQAFLALFIGMLGMQLAAMSGRHAALDFERLATTIRAQARPEDLVLVYARSVSGISYYSQRRVVSVHDWGELGFGSRQGDQHAFFWPDDAQLLEAWRSGRRVFLVANRSDLEALLPQLQPPPRIIASRDKKVLLVNFSER